MLWERRITQVAREIATQFERGELLICDLDGHGISTMAVEYKGRTISLSWYEHVDRRKPRSFSIGGDSTYPKGPDSRHIFRAAWARADREIDEYLKSLAQLA